MLDLHETALLKEHETLVEGVARVIAVEPDQVWLEPEQSGSCGGCASSGCGAKGLGTVASYREENAICPEWSELNQLTRCTVKLGARIVVGPGQSASCMAMVYDKSPVNQVYMANDTRVGMLHVEGCTQLGMWPQ